MRVGRRMKGSITIFLLLIFVANYVLAGVLVDGGRVKLATFMAESALDSATQSALTYYDNLLFDLYGLFALEQGDGEGDINEQLEELMQSYLEQTLQVAGAGDGQDELASQINEAIFNGFSFEVTAEGLEASSSLNLSQPAVTQTQIIDHMKYRAPLQLTQGASDFVNSLIELTELRGKLEAVNEVMEKTEDKGQQLYTEANKALEEVQHLRDRVGIFVKDPAHNDVKSTNPVTLAGHRVSSIAPADMWKYIDDFDISMRVTFNRTAEEEQSENELGKIKNEDLKQHKEHLVQQLDAVVSNSEFIASEAVKVEKRLKEASDQLHNYVKELEELSKNEDYQEIVEPQIAHAQALTGSLLAQIGFASDIQQHTPIDKDEDAQTTSYTTHIGYAADAVIGNINDGMKEASLSLRDSITKDTLFEQDQIFINDANEKLQKLAGLFNQREPIEVADEAKSKPDVSKTEKAKELEELPSSTALDKLKAIDAADIAGAVDATSSNLGKLEQLMNDMDMPNISFANTGAVIGKLLTMVDDIVAAIAVDTRDSLYINEYILSYFRNYVHHGTMVDKMPAESDADKRFALYLLEEPYQPYAHTIGEVEYILEGKLGKRDNVQAVQGKILALRTVLNIISIIMDRGMWQMAISLSSPAGPFAPLVAVVILAGWAVAESVLDVDDIMHGKKVAFLKKRGDWQLSATQLLNRAKDFIASNVLSRVNSKADQLLDQWEASLHSIIYDLYYNNEVVNGEAQQLLDEMEEHINTQMPQLAEFSGEFIKPLREEVDRVSFAGRDELISFISKQIDTIKKEKKAKLEDMLNGIDEGALSSLDPYFPGGKKSKSPVKTASFAFGYSDYLRLFLFFMPNEKKVQRIQQIIQVNMRKAPGRSYTADNGFRMNQARVNVAADLEVSIKYLFLTSSFMPKTTDYGDRHVIKVQANRAY